MTNLIPLPHVGALAAERSCCNAADARAQAERSGPCVVRGLGMEKGDLCSQVLGINGTPRIESARPDGCFFMGIAPV
jgi:hypothetical protein